ncbi:MAG: TolC family protein [Pseudomonadota bacterium]
MDARSQLRLLPLAFFSVVFAFCSAAHGQSIEESISAAFDSNPDLEVADANIDVARAGVGQARAAYRPQISFQSSISAAERDARLPGGNSFQETSEPVSATISAQQPLYTNGLRTIASRQAVLGVREQRLLRDASKESLALTVIDVYASLSQTQEDLQISIETERLLSDQVRAEEERLRLGTGTRTDVSQVQARLARARAEISRQRFQLQSIRASFELVTGLVPERVSWPNELPSVPPGIDLAVSEGRENSARLAATRTSSERARLDVASANRRYGPQVSLNIEASTAREPSPAIDQDDEVRASLSLSLPLFSGGRKTADRREAIARRSASLAALRSEDIALVQDITSAWYRLESANAELSAVAAEISAAEATLEGVSRGRSAGLWSVTDVLDAAEQLNTAKRRRVAARASRDAAQFQLSILTGRYTLPETF